MTAARLSSLLASVVLSCLAPCLVAQSLVPRLPYETGPVRVPVNTQVPDLDVQHDLIVKGVDAALLRADGSGAVLSRAGADLSALTALAAEWGLSFAPAIHIDEARLAQLEQRGAARSGRAQPDLAGLLSVAVPGEGAARLVGVGQRLADLELIEFAYVRELGTPPPGDIAPATPDLSANQGYRGPDPGIDAEAAWAQGLTGAGIRLSDCEYGWNPDHEDLVDAGLVLEPGQTIHPSVYANGWDSHGTAVAGETSAVSNAYGCTGLAHGSPLFTYTEWSVEQGFRRLTAIGNAISDSAAGDVVLLEMQTTGAGGGYGPAELDPSVHALVSAGVAAGVVVVGAAGNGNQNLDSGSYATYMGWGDSGAILVGAGSASTAHAKLSFSTYGSRVNLQGWGGSVFSLGYGDFAQYGGDKNQRYTGFFSGTSSASPIVASACCLVQERSLQANGAPLDPSLLRQLLIDTGRPQGSGGHIGPLPDVASALLNLGDFDPHPWVDLGHGLAGANGVPLLTPSGVLVPGTSFSMEVSDARAVTFAWWILGLSAVELPFKGGVLVPSPDLIAGPFVTGFGGQLTLSGSSPSGVPPGVEVATQFWIEDQAGPAGWAATNGVVGTTQ